MEWDALGFYARCFSLFKAIKVHFVFFLLSNTNEIHIQEIENRVGAAFFLDFCSLFEKVYLSHELGLRKPHTDVFNYILKEKGLKQMKRFL